MIFGLNTFLNYFGSRKVLSSSNSTHLPNARRNPRAARRSRSTRLHAAENAARVHNRRSTANAAPNSDKSTNAAGTGIARAAKQRGTKYRRAKVRPVTASKRLRRRNTVLVPQPPTHPRPPGAFIVEPSFVVPGYPELDDRNLPPCVEQKIFFDALDKGRETLLRAEEEQMERDEQARYQHQLEQDSETARSACHGCRAEDDAEHARLREEDLRKAEAARRQVEKEELARLLEEDRRKAWEAHRRAMEQERHRQAEREAMERKRREQKERHRQAEREAHHRAMEQERQRQAEREAMERRERERREKECHERKAALSSLVTPLRAYEDRWAALRSNAVDVKPLRFYDIPWPSFDHVRDIEDLTEERVFAFVSQLHEHIQGPGGGQTKPLRLEMLRWHPDKFNGQVLEKVVERDRDAVRNGAGRIIRILNAFINRMR
ncbi:hypothetical protein V8E52_011279 [Russula decolorans]|jgi:hypothetical protein